MTHSFNYPLLGLLVNLVLALGTLVIAVFAVLQARAAKLAARAADMNATALIESQRPQITLKPHNRASETLVDMTTPRVTVELENVGQTTAHNLVYETWIELLNSPFDDFTTAAAHFESGHQTSLSPGAPSMVINIPLQRSLSRTDVQELKAGSLLGCFRVYVAYADVFGGLGYANFGFCVTASGLTPLTKYNDAGRRGGTTPAQAGKL